MTQMSFRFLLGHTALIRPDGKPLADANVLPTCSIRRLVGARKKMSLRHRFDHRWSHRALLSCTDPSNEVRNLGRSDIISEGFRRVHWSVDFVEVCCRPSLGQIEMEFTKSELLGRFRRRSAAPLILSDTVYWILVDGRHFRQTEGFEESGHLGRVDKGGIERLSWEEWRAVSERDNDDASSEHLQ